MENKKKINKKYIMVFDGEKKKQLCLNIKNVENLIKNPIIIDECEINTLTLQNVQTINTNFNDMKINTVKFLDSKTHIINGLFRGCGIEKLIFIPGDNYLLMCGKVFQDNNISILDIDRESSNIEIYYKAFEKNIIRKVKLKTTGKICIDYYALANNIIKSFIIEGIPKKIHICEGALKNNKIKELKLQATDKIEIDFNALIDNPIESIYLDAPNINIYHEFFNIKTLKVVYMPKNARYIPSNELCSKMYFDDIKKYGLKIEFI